MKKIHYLTNIDILKHDALDGMTLSFQGPQGMQGIRGGPGDSGQPVSIITVRRRTAIKVLFPDTNYLSFLH